MSSARSKGSLPSGHTNGIGGELKQLRADTTATVDELREFLASAEGKSPQEMLGAIAQSGLFLSTLLSAAGIAAVLVVFTVVPYLIWGSGKPGEKPAAAAAADNDPATDDGADATAPTDGDASATTDGETTTASGDETLDKLGIGETKTADPKSNPLDKDLENLLEID